MTSVKNVLVALGVAFTAYLAARGLWWTEDVPYPLVVVAALGLYLATTWICIFWEPPRQESAEDAVAEASAKRPQHRLPVPAQMLALASAAIVPTGNPAGKRSPNPEVTSTSPTFTSLDSGTLASARRSLRPVP